MARIARNTPLGTVQHVISRYVNREIRVTEPAERANYLRRYARTLSRTDWLALAYALMGNHNHLGNLAGRARLYDLYHPVNSGFRQWLNDRQGREGPLFRDRPHNVTFDRGLTGILIAYIHNNPVRAGVVADPADSDWTSHRAFIGEAPAPAWLDVELALRLCGFDATPAGRLAFHEFVVSRAGLPRDPMLSGETSQHVRTEMRRELGADIELTASVEAAGSRYEIMARPMAALVPRWRGTVPTLLEAVSRETRVPLSEIRSKTRRREVVRARRLALLVWTARFGRDQGELASAVGIGPSAASQLLAKSGPLKALEGVADRVERRARRRSGAAQGATRVGLGS